MNVVFYSDKIMKISMFLKKKCLLFLLLVFLGFSCIYMRDNVRSSANIGVSTDSLNLDTDSLKYNNHERV